MATIQSLLNRIRPRSFIVLYYVALVLGLILAAAYYYLESYLMLQGFVYSSDSLYLPSLFDDLSQGMSLGSWNLPPTPYFFPDMLLYFFVRVFTPDTHIAIVGFGLVQYLLFALGMMLIANRVMPNWYGLCRSGLIAVMGLCFVTFIRQLEFYAQMIFVSAHHFGVVLMIPYTLLIVIRQLSDDRNPPEYLYMLWIVAFLTSGSDGLFLIQVALPVAGSLFLLAFTRLISVRRAGVISGIVLTGAVLGLLLSLSVTMRNELVGGYLFRPDFVSASFSNFPKFVSTVWETHPLHLILVLFTMAMCMFVVIRFLVGRYSENTDDGRIEPFVAFFFILSVSGNITAIGALGVATDPNTLRYFLPLLVFSGFWGLPFLLPSSKPRFLKSRNTRLLESAILLILIIGIGLVLSPKKLRNAISDGFFVYYPPITQCIDEYGSQFGLRYGLAHYWQARLISMTSQEGVEVLQVQRDLSPYYWINNSESYRIEPEFVIIDLSLPRDHALRIDEDLIVQRFGEPKIRSECANVRVLIYGNDNRSFATLFQ